MKTPSQKFLEKLGAKEPQVQPQRTSDEKENDRRSFLKKSAMGGMMLGGFMFSSIEDTLAQSTSKVNRNSSPADLKITDMRYAVVMNGNGRCPVIRIDTNQGIYGLGEVRDGASYRYAMFLKSRILGMNPCSVELMFRRIKQFGFHGRQAGEFAQLKWRFGIWLVRLTTFLLTSCWGENSEIESGCTPTRHKETTRRSLSQEFKNG